MATNQKGQAKMWIGTYNKKEDKLKPEVAEEYLRHWVEGGHAHFATGQIECGKNGTHHIQFFLHMKKKVTVTGLKKVCGHAHF